MSNKLLVVCLISLLSASPSIAQPVRPDQNLTPGAFDPNVHFNDVCPSEKISRPSISKGMRKRILKKYGMTEYCAEHPCELDHRYPFSLGGATTEQNLWPEAKDMHPGALDKDRLEVLAHTRYCERTWTIDQARHLFDDWLDSYDRLYGR